MDLAKSISPGLIAKPLQHGSSTCFRHPAWQGIAALCALLVLLAGAFAANPVWHAVLHGDDDHGAPNSGPHEEGALPGHDDESACVVCAFAHQQVNAGDVDPVMGPVTGRLEWVAVSAPSPLRLVLVWPEPSGRGPPVGW